MTNDDQAHKPSDDNWEKSAISNPAKVTERASGLMRLPWQAGQEIDVKNCATLRFMEALLVLAKVSST